MFESCQMPRQPDSEFAYLTSCGGSRRECLKTTSKAFYEFDRGRYREWNRLRLTNRCSELSGGATFSDHANLFRQPVR